MGRTTILTEELVFNIHVVLRIPDYIAIGSLDAVLGQDTAAPVGAASDQLGIDGTSVIQILRM